MKIAFIILAHKNPTQVVELVRLLKVDGDHIFIHFDNKAKQDFCNLQKILPEEENIFYVKKRIACRWGQFSIVNATLQCIKTVIEKEESYDNIILLSGQDFPLKPINEIKTFLAANVGKEFIESFQISTKNRWTNQGGYFQATKRIHHFHFFLRRFHFYIPLNRTLPKSLIPYGGHQWWILTGDCLRYIYNYTQENHNLVNYFKFTFIPDEIFFQTIICNSLFKDKITGYNLTYTDWNNPNPLPPRILEKDDIKSVTKTNCLFARKIELGRSNDFIDYFKKKNE